VFADSPKFSLIILYNTSIYIGAFLGLVDTDIRKGQSMSVRNHKSAKSRSLRVLIDMDGVLCNFEEYTLEQFRTRYPNEPFICLDKRRTFYVADEYDVLHETIANVDDEGQLTLGVSSCSFLFNTFYVILRILP